MSQDFLNLTETNKPVIEKIDRIPHNVQYTPSKLKDSLLYIQANSLKKDEEKNSKLRELRAENELLQERLTQSRQEMLGIEESLTKQISMYKKFLDQMERNYELKLKDIQADFHLQMQVYIKQEQDRAKIVQADKEKLEAQIQYLRTTNQVLEGRLNEALRNVEGLQSEKQLLHTSQKEIGFEMEEIKQMKEREVIRQQDQIAKLKKEIFEKQESFKLELHRALLEKDQQMEELKKQNLWDMAQLEEKIASQNSLKNSETHQITKTFNSEAQRLSGQLQEREQTIENLKIELSEEKEKLLETVRAFDKEIGMLIFEKGKLVSEIDSLKCTNLKFADREKVLIQQPKDLNIEMGTLRDMLLESSNQLARCKEDLVYMETERSRLIAELSRYEVENAYLERSRRATSRRY